MTREYVILIEQAADGKYGAYVPDLPGCAVVGYATQDEARQSIAEAIDMHLKGLAEDGEPIPEPTIHADVVVTTAA